MKRGVHAVAWVVLAVAAFVLWPERWGGSMTYVITSGVSMQPAFEQGDLAVLRRTGDYRVGDVAAYESPELQRVVMHRITTVSDQGYTFQGDNNDFLDPETVTEEQMLGELVVRVPGVGSYLTWFLRPLNLAIAAVALLLLLGDRQKETVVPPTIGRLRLSALELPPSYVLAQVADQADLERLAAQYDLPVLEIDGDEGRYLIDGSVVYTWGQALVRPTSGRKAARGSSKGGKARHLQPVSEAEDQAAG